MKRKPGRPKDTKKPGPKYLSEGELKAFKSALAQSGTLRDQVMMRLCLHLGLRVTELVSICIQDIDEESHALTVKALKGGRTRTYSALPESIWKSMMKWIKKEKPEDLLFPVTAQTAKNAFKRIAKEAGINSSFSIHTLRHTCGILQARAGFSPIQIMLHLRHREISSTMVYVEQVVFDKADENMNQLMTQYL